MPESIGESSRESMENTKISSPWVSTEKDQKSNPSIYHSNIGQIVINNQNIRINTTKDTIEQGTQTKTSLPTQDVQT